MGTDTSASYQVLKKSLQRVPPIFFARPGYTLMYSGTFIVELLSQFGLGGAYL